MLSYTKQIEEQNEALKEKCATLEKDNERCKIRWVEHEYEKDVHLFQNGINFCFAKVFRDRARIIAGSQMSMRLFGGEWTVQFAIGVDQPKGQNQHRQTLEEAKRYVEAVFAS